ncbi:transposase [Bacillus cereus]
MNIKAYNRQIKMIAVQLIGAESIFVKEVARELSFYSEKLYRWISENETYGENTFPGREGLFYHSRYEMKRLKRENKKLKRELNSLKNFRFS